MVKHAAARQYRHMTLRLATHSLLDFNSPLSDDHAAELVDALRPLANSTVLDLGCGWAELLLRTVADEPTARAIGVDSDPVAMARAAANVEERELRQRVVLHTADAASWDGPPVDVALSIGASHAWGGTAAALSGLHTRVRTGGRVLFGDAFWEREPTAAALSGLDAEAEDFLSLQDLVALTETHGYRLLHLSVASQDEWDSFESRWCGGAQRWLLDNPDLPDHAALQATVDEHRRGWLAGYRGVLGLAYLVLVKT